LKIDKEMPEEKRLPDVQKEKERSRRPEKDNRQGR
jgi:hypothetical protein